MARCKVQIMRAAGVGDAASPIEVFMGGEQVFALAPDELKTMFLDADDVRVAFRRGQTVLLEATLPLERGQQLTYQLERAKPSGLFGVFKAAQVQVKERARRPLPAPAPVVVKEITQQMWLGHADTQDTLFELMRERPEHYADDNEDANGAPIRVPLSQFAELLGVVFYDHDFLEYGVAKPGDSVAEKFADHSWASQWGPIVETTQPERIWKDANAVIMLGVDDYKGRKTPQIRAPMDIVAPGLSLRYIGEITHPSR